MYAAAKAQGRFAVGGTASTVAAAGGYVQGAGHSSMAPFLGLAADNCLGEYYVQLACAYFLIILLHVLELNVVVADGQLITANAVENYDRMLTYCLAEFFSA